MRGKNIVLVLIQSNLTMSNISYIKRNILKATTYPRILIHSCNCNGSWGGGVAYQIANHFPRAEDVYIRICDKYGNKLLGKCVLIPSYEDSNLLIGCLFTSASGGASHDSKETILKYTELSLKQLQEQISVNDISIDNSLKTITDTLVSDIRGPLKNYKLEMPKINSGIFGVPWDETEATLESFNTSMDFTVYVI